MCAHRDDLRDEVAQELKDGKQPLGAGWSGDPAAFAADIAAQGSEAAPTPRLRALLQYAERLTVAPASVTAEHVEALRDAGFDDRAIHDAAQVAAYFGYINRIADGLGVDLEPEMRDAPSSSEG